MTIMQELLLSAAKQQYLRCIDVQFAIMVASDNEPEVMLAAALVSKKSGEGHICLPLSHLIIDKTTPVIIQSCFSLLGTNPDWYHILLHSSAVSVNGVLPAPLILSRKRLYLNRLWHHECRVAHFFTKDNKSVNYDKKKLSNILNALFGVSNEINWQKIAAAVVLTRRISLIFGGPGTGKTTTIMKLLTAMIQLYDNNKCRIHLTAPTGKAAARLTSLLSSAFDTLQLNKSQLKYFPNEASTIHRLLGIKYSNQRPHYHANNLLHLDILVVDEASMVDLVMMSYLINALPVHARVIFLGDPDQLASVGAGAVLGDICAYAYAGYTTLRAQELSLLTGYKLNGNNDTTADILRDSSCLLKKNYRFRNNSGINQLAMAINYGNYCDVQRIFCNNFNDLKKRTLFNSRDYMIMLDELTQGYQSFLAQVQQQMPPISIITEFSKYRILCALRTGLFGVTGLNEYLEQMLIKKHKIKLLTHSQWYDGRPIMILRNDNELGLFNGDIGIALDRGNGLRIWFQISDGTLKSVQPSCLPDHETAWAITVHKAQGSEFEHIALILPSQMSPVVTRELVYTGVTRACSQLSLYANDDILAQAIACRTERHSGLGEIFN